MIILGSVLTVAVCAYALARGGEAERVIAKAALAILLVSLALQTVSHRGTAWPVVAADLCLAVTINIVAAIHLRAWLYVESGLAMALLILHALVLQSDGPRVTPLYAAAVNGLTLAMLATLAVATRLSRGDGVREHLGAEEALSPGA